MPPVLSVDDLVTSITAGRVPGQRRLVGVVGPPGAGKTHLARHLAASVGPQARIVAMDGYHLPNGVLDRLGRRQFKGALDTFDVAGLVALMDRLRSHDEVVMAPGFSRQLDEPLADAVVVEPSVEVVFIEGNYLLVDGGGWAEVGRRLDLTCYVEAPDDLRHRRLMARHERSHGSRAAAEAWIDRVDRPNATLVAGTRHRADVIVQPSDLPGEPLW